MDKLLTYITKKLRETCRESYYDKNMSGKVVYPYLTFDVDTQMNPNQRYQETAPIDIDIFDNNTGGDYTAIFNIETRLKSELAYQRDLTDDFGVAWQFMRATNIPTGQDDLIRRTLQFQLLIDWRNF